MVQDKISKKYYVYCGEDIASKSHILQSVKNDNNYISYMYTFSFDDFKKIDFEPGESIKICQNNQDFLDLDFMLRMKNYDNKVSTITNVYRGDRGCEIYYALNIDDSTCLWSAAWFLPESYNNNKNDKNYDDGDLLNQIYDILGD